MLSCTTTYSHSEIRRRGFQGCFLDMIWPFPSLALLTSPQSLSMHLTLALRRARASKLAKPPDYFDQDYSSHNALPGPSHFLFSIKTTFPMVQAGGGQHKRPQEFGRIWTLGWVLCCVSVSHQDNIILFKRADIDGPW